MDEETAGTLLTLGFDLAAAVAIFIGFLVYRKCRGDNYHTERVGAIPGTISQGLHNKLLYDDDCDFNPIGDTELKNLKKQFASNV